MCYSRPLGRHTRTNNTRDLELQLVTSVCVQFPSRRPSTHSTLRTPSRAVPAAVGRASLPSVRRIPFIRCCQNPGFPSPRMLSKCSSSSPSWHANRPVTSELGVDARGNVVIRQPWRPELFGHQRSPVLARSACCCGGQPAAVIPAKSSVEASCLPKSNHTNAPSSPSWPYIRCAQRPPLSHTTKAAVLLARRRRLATAVASAQEALGSTPSSNRPLQPGDLDELLYTPGEEIPYYMGPLELREVPDAGVGVFVTEDVPCGTVLLACYPLALLRGRPMGPGSSSPMAAIPSPLELAHAMDGALMSPLAAAWMLGLYDGVDDDDDGEAIDGSSGRGGAGNRMRQRLGQLRQLFLQPFDANSAAPAEGEKGENGNGEGEEGSSGTAAEGRAAGGRVRCPLAADAVARIATFNAYGEARPDPAVAAVRLLAGEQLSGCVGLWPPFSLINHSCAPVASYGLVGDVMVVRAAIDLSSGQQVTISYIGRRALAPLEFRRAYLAQHYGFVCTCERCTLEAAGLEEEQEEEEMVVIEGEEVKRQVRNKTPSGRLPMELPAFLENLHTTCNRAAAPHLNDMLTGRRWTAAATAGSGASATVRINEPVSELVEELSELYGYLSDCWQQLLRAAAAAAAGDSTESDAAVAAESEEGEGEGAVGVCLSQEEVLWLEGSVFVLLDQLLVVVGTLGLLGRVQEHHERANVAAKVKSKAATAGEVGSGRKGSVRRKAATAAAAAAAAGKASGADEDAVTVIVEKGDGGGDATAAVPQTAAAAMRAVASRRWRVEELPSSFLMPYVDLLAQAQEVASTVAPGSDLAVACTVRLLYGIQAVLGSESDDFRQAEISCYDAISARYGVLDYDLYEQILEVCVQQYGAQEVRLPRLDVPAAAAARGAAQPSPPPPASFLLDGSAETGGMTGLRLPVVPVDVEVVE